MTTFEQWVNIEQLRIEMSLARDNASSKYWREGYQGNLDLLTKDAKKLMNTMRKGSRARVIYR